MFPLKDNIPSKTFPFITYLIVFLNVLLFIHELTLAAGLDALIGQYALTPANINFNNFDTLYPFVTSAFLHGGWLHILGNMWFLIVFGDNVEDKFGHIKFLLFYLAAAFVAAFAQYAAGPTSATPIIGASGAVAGVLGSYILLFPRSKILTLVFIIIFVTLLEIPAYLVLGFWFILQLLNGIYSLDTTITGSLIAYWAHIAGFLFGLVISVYYKAISKN
ncbi:MAG: Rhomboid family protein [candidate division CPR2 bacterium GW2011_GWC1_39_9]|uniref:Rhomboid family protein n=1 Tax=candidate division CPR2 bacterium GW2011_GWC2_39_10 TaxID=1618345 RepID=A0A0G0LSE8_UNCC2|nr:MAG: Rhomboid family protein [candidate division CPR2 bacterium GW2011_GWC2_39_10]KKR34599.1 MAG: Rhomboid family protein [candidate division CPR2 bacterium GW2011_GWC1_39_9]